MPSSTVESPVSGSEDGDRDGVGLGVRMAMAMAMGIMGMAMAMAMGMGMVMGMVMGMGKAGYNITHILQRQGLAILVIIVELMVETFSL